jgi:hypothetical protein
MLSELCSTYQDEVEKLAEADDYLVRLAGLTQRLAKDATEQIADYPHGEPVALIQLCGQVLQWSASEAAAPEDRQRRHGRQQAVIVLLVFCHAIAGFHGGSAAQQREGLAEHRARIADALKVP